MSDPTPTQWGAEALWEQLEPLLPGLSVEVVARVASTNSTLLERARASAGHDAADARLPGQGKGQGQIRGEAPVQVRRSIESNAFGRRSIDLQPSLLVAEQQSAGRGRQGRPWRSNPRASLTFSLGLPLATPDWSGLSLAVGVALCEALDPIVAAGPAAPGPRLGLKWPNDLWLLDGPLGASPLGRKLGGILVETVSAGAQRLVIIGVGLNISAFQADEVHSGFAALQEIDPNLSAPAALSRIALPLVQALQLFEREGFAAFAQRFAARDLLRGHAIYTTLAEAPEGVVRGVSAHGALRVETATGIVDVSSGEVSVRPAPSL